jgi:hypothetical protein
VGPGDGALAGIDPDLRPPRTREFVAGIEASPGEGWRGWLLPLGIGKIISLRISSLSNAVV